MGGSSKQKQTTFQTRDPYSPAKPAIDQSISGVQSWLSDPGSAAAYGWDMSPETTAGIGTLGASKYGNQSLDYFSDVVGGKYLDAGNPWQADLDASIKAAVMPSVNATFSNAGMAGSTLHQGALTQGLTSGLAAPRYQNYQFERGNQGQAAGLLPGLEAGIGQNQIAAGQLKEGYDKARFDEQRTAGLRPYQETAPLLQGFGSMGGTSEGTTTSKSTPSLGSQLLGGAMTIGGMMFNPWGTMASSAGGLMGGGASYAGMGASAPAYAEGLPWAPDRGANPWAYTITR